MLDKLKLYWKKLEGRRTYLIASVGTILNVAIALYPNLLSSTELLKIDGVLVALGGAALRASISR